MNARTIPPLLLLAGWALCAAACQAIDRSASEYADEARERLAKADKLFAEQRYAEAIDDYRFVIWVRPELSLGAYKNLAFIYEHGGKDLDAAKVYKKGAAYMKGDKEFYASSLRLYRKLNFLEEGLIAGKRLLELSPGDQEVRQTVDEMEKALAARKKEGKGE